jgi:hypothetical protein
MSKPTPDFYDVQLSAAGQEMAGAGNTVRFATAKLDYTFTVGKTVKVLTSEWNRVLSLQMYEGNPILQIAPIVLASAPANATPQQELQALKVEEATVTAEIADSTQKGSK